MKTRLNFLEKKNIIVTGGAGFIGSHLCERLVQDDVNVICMDDLSHATIQHVQHLLQYPNFEFIKYDVTQPIRLEDFDELHKFNIEFQGVQEIYHLASQTNPKEEGIGVVEALATNSQAMLSTLNLAVHYGATYLFTSSSVVYGAALLDHQAFHETDHGTFDHMSPRGAYNEGKRFAETCVGSYRRVYDLNTKIARVFTTYGPRMKFGSGSLIADFIAAALDGQDLVVYGNRERVVSLCYVSDMVDGLLRLMRSGKDVTLLNLGSDHAETMVDIAERIIAMTGSSSHVVRQEPASFLTKKGMPDLRRAKEQLGWIPLMRLEDGLRKTIDYIIARK